MVYTQHFFINGKLLGTATRLPERRTACFILPDSDLYFCPRCGDVWARFPVYDDLGAARPWRAWRQSCYACRKHAQYRSEWPGCIWRALEEEFTKTLPPEVLRRELLLHLEHYSGDLIP